uniref:Uncharacterized protein n=1 Tax=Chromera velia CCMP2878 TaxID=1169474 RepID=A0A0G4F6T7_9ALVE|eukprot:Cvel_15334.t1-p1 / transcript=Cvel_15334.t1 / gene=Cvel_15334 / organism=Chromera_velia_CCMP2878 / gene_product=hypothetical protein / transcript_product=hypothetical protein / location=Cvel_scaffold1128:2908-3734(+) / protein_length=137 / sequence_SO=supercontig / SO=protein_coding / is_pseudo=false
MSLRVLVFLSFACVAALGLHLRGGSGEYAIAEPSKFQCCCAGQPHGKRSQYENLLVGGTAREKNPEGAEAFSLEGICSAKYKGACEAQLHPASFQAGALYVVPEGENCSRCIPQNDIYMHVGYERPDYCSSSFALRP